MKLQLAVSNNNEELSREVHYLSNHIKWTLNSARWEDTCMGCVKGSFTMTMVNRHSNLALVDQFGVCLPHFPFILDL
jgi:hypothetical protein